MNRIRKGDDVVVIAGRDAGRRGTVLKIVDEDRLVVEGVSLIKRHRKPNPARGVAGGIVEEPAPIHISNVMLFNPISQKGDRVGFKVLEDGRKVRIFKSSGEVVDV